MTIIDSHLHLWNLEQRVYEWLTPDAGVLYRNYELDEVLPDLAAAGVDGAVLVQAANTYEDTYAMLAEADANEVVRGVVGWVPLWRHDEAAAALKSLAANPHFVGVRHLIHDEADPDWIVRPDVIEGLRLLAEHNLTFDVVGVLPRHLEHVSALAEKIPNLRLIIDHLNKPDIAGGGWEPWASLLAVAAEHDNVSAKISGLNTAAQPDWKASDLQRYIDHALECFGPQRLLYGGDWPVTLLAGDYAQVWAATNEVLAGLDTEDREAIFGGNAERIYRLGAREPRRYGQVIELKADGIEEYERLHAAVPTEVLDMIGECNIGNYSIFRYGTMLFAYMEYTGDDFATDGEKMAADEATQRWWAKCGPLQQPVPESTNWWHTLPEVFHTP